MEMENLYWYGIVAVIGVVFIIVFTAVGKSKPNKKGCCGCRSEGDEESVSGHEDTLVPSTSVQLRRDVGRGGGRANTWPWQNKRPLHKQIGGVDALHASLGDKDAGSSVIFSSNSLCLKIVQDDDEMDRLSQNLLSLVNDHADNDNNRDPYKMDDLRSVQSVMSDFGEEVLRGVQALDSPGKGMSDSLRNIAGSIDSANVERRAAVEKVKWIVGEDELEDPVEMTDDEEDVALVVSDGDETDGELGSLRDIVLADHENAGLGVADALVVGKEGPSVVKYRYSLAREQILCCSSNTSSLALESPWLGSNGSDELAAKLRHEISNNFGQDHPKGNPLHPFMLYRYSISLEEVRVSSRSLSSNIPAVLLPLPLTKADEEDVFYDARSSLGSTRSSIVAMKNVNPQGPPEEIQHLNETCFAAALPVLSRAPFYSASADTSPCPLRRCSSLQIM